LNFLKDHIYYFDLHDLKLGCFPEMKMHIFPSWFILNQGNIYCICIF
jgi:hypothetical protein